MNAQQFLMMAAKQGCAWNINALSALASRSGLRFTSDDLLTAAEELWGSLSEDQLRGVAGGVPGSGNGNGNGYPHDNPPPGHLPDGTEGWAPPPGDVSGNSCFFIRPR